MEKPLKRFLNSDMFLVNDVIDKLKREMGKAWATGWLQPFLKRRRVFVQISPSIRQTLRLPFSHALSIWLAWCTVNRSQLSGIDFNMRDPPPPPFKVHSTGIIYANNFIITVMHYLPPDHFLVTTMTLSISFIALLGSQEGRFAWEGNRTINVSCWIDFHPS